MIYQFKNNIFIYFVTFRNTGVNVLKNVSDAHESRPLNSFESNETFLLIEPYRHTTYSKREDFYN